MESRMKTLRSVVEPSLLGGVDGLVTSFAIVASSHYTSSPTTVVTVVGFSSLVADGMSMGISQYLSASSEGRITDPTRPSPIVLGAACALSFVLFGSVPLVAFVVGDGSMAAAVCSTLLLLALLGVLRVLPASAHSTLKSMLRTCILGAVAGGLAYLVAALTSDAVDDGSSASEPLVCD